MTDMLRPIGKLFILAALLSGGLSGTASAFSLEQVEQDVREDYPEIRHVTPEFLEGQQSAESALIFDVREEDEYAVSHLPGAIRITPGMNARSFLKRFGTQASGKRVIFYCSVGVRSSQ
ncbi:MAG: rhodanese-like domain-containing protein, partial [Pseudomonadota bacterium]